MRKKIKISFISLYIHMKYTATLKGKELEFNYDPSYDPMDFIRNNEDIDLFTIEDGEPKIDMATVVKIMCELYKNLLETNYL